MINLNAVEPLISNCPKCHLSLLYVASYKNLFRPYWVESVPHWHIVTVDRYLVHVQNQF